MIEGGEFPTVNGVGQQGLVRFAVKALAPNKQGPVVTGGNFVPSLVSLSAGTARVAFQANWDRRQHGLDVQARSRQQHRVAGLRRRR